MEKAKAKKSRERGGDAIPKQLEDDAAKAFKRFIYGESRFGKINKLAIENLSMWVPDLLPAAWSYHDGYRVSSVDLGRPLEEDLSVVALGIVDFGLHDMGDIHNDGHDREGRRSPLDLVIEWMDPEPGDFNDNDDLMRAVPGWPTASAYRSMNSK